MWGHRIKKDKKGETRLVEKLNAHKILIDAADGTKLLRRLHVNENIILKRIFRYITFETLTAMGYGPV